jgi:hypothetical protein
MGESSTWNRQFEAKKALQAHPIGKNNEEKVTNCKEPGWLGELEPHQNSVDCFYACTRNISGGCTEYDACMDP